jgi:hypothetical protein
MDSKNNEYDQTAAPIEKLSSSKSVLPSEPGDVDAGPELVWDWEVVVGEPIPPHTPPTGSCS